jgi:hypothetical protein
MITIQSSGAQRLFDHPVYIPIDDCPNFKFFYYIQIVAIWTVIPYSLVREYQRLEEHTTSIFRAEVTEKSLPWKSENVAIFHVKNALP